MSRRSPETLDPAAQRELAAIDDALAGRALEPELAELERLVQEVRPGRPEPTDRFAQELDRRVAIGFGRADGRWRAPGGVARAALRRLGRRGALLPAMGRGRVALARGRCGRLAVARRRWGDRAVLEALRRTQPPQGGALRSRPGRRGPAGARSRVAADRRDPFRVGGGAGWIARRR
jgi:hypothetical protein